MNTWMAAGLLLLAGCGGGSLAQQTEPGGPTPSGLSACTGAGATGRCASWRPGNRDACIHWNGLDARAEDGRPTPVVPCDQVPRRMRPVGVNGAFSPIWAEIDAERAAAGQPPVP